MTVNYATMAFLPACRLWQPWTDDDGGNLIRAVKLQSGGVFLMRMHSGLILALSILAAVLCFSITVPTPVTAPIVDFRDLQFSGDRCFQLVEEFVTSFPDRHSGADNCQESALWLEQQFAELGLYTFVQPFSAVLYGENTDLYNVVAIKPGRARTQIVFVAHHDQATTTIQGADNNGSGVGIILHLAEIFADRDLHHTLVFLSTDAEEYGMLGSRHFMAQHASPELIAAAISVDNVGRTGAHGIHMAVVGQGRGYTSPALAAFVQDTAEIAGTWIPSYPPPLFQALERSLYISFTDQGPFLTAGVPAVGFGVDTDHWPHYHGPTDTIDYQSAATLAEVGRLSEALVYALDQQLPLSVAGPVIYRPDTRQHTPPWAVRIGFLLLLVPLIAAVISDRRHLPPAATAALLTGRTLLFSLPLIACWASLRLLTRLNLLPRFEFYPATPLDPVLYDVQWGALLITAFIVAVTTTAVIRLAPARTSHRSSMRLISMIILLVTAIMIWLLNPFALILTLPALWLWPLIGGSRFRRLLCLFTGGLALYGLLFFFGLLIQLGPFILWYLALMLGTGMVSIHAALAAAIIIGQGLALTATTASHPIRQQSQYIDK